MTNAQLEAFKEIMLNGERYTIPFLAIRKTTERAMLKNGWICEDMDKYFITVKGFEALEKAGY